MVQWETDSAVSTSVPLIFQSTALHSTGGGGGGGGRERAGVEKERSPSLEEVSYGLCISARCLYLSPASLAHHSPFSLFFFFFFSSFRFVVSTAVYMSCTASSNTTHTVWHYYRMMIPPSTNNIMHPPRVSTLMPIIKKRKNGI